MIRIVNHCKLMDSNFHISQVIHNGKTAKYSLVNVLKKENLLLFILLYNCN